MVYFNLTIILLCNFSCVIVPLVTFSLGYALLFASPTAISRVYFDPINYYFD